MKRPLSIIIVTLTFICCGQKTKDISEIDQDSSTTLSAEKDKILPKDETVKIRIFPLDSILEISYTKYKDYKGEYRLSGVNIIDRRTNEWIFDSDGPQIESYSDIKKVTDTLFVVSVYYDVVTPIDTIRKKIQIAKFDLVLNHVDKSYRLSKDTLFWPTTAPYTSKDIERSINDYKTLMETKFLSDSTNADQPNIWAMFKVQNRLLSSFISGCDSCSIYADRLFDKYDYALFASDSDYSGEIYSVYNILERN